MEQTLLLDTALDWNSGNLETRKTNEIVLSHVSDLMQRVVSENKIQDIDSSSIKLDVIATKEEPGVFTMWTGSQPLKRLLVRISYESEKELLSTYLKKCVQNTFPNHPKKYSIIPDKHSDHLGAFWFPEIHSFESGNEKESRVKLLQIKMEQFLISTTPPDPITLAVRNLSFD